MITWISSYPRAGNSLIRLMLLRVWGIRSYSIYGDRGDIDNPSIAEQIGHQPLGRPFDQAYEEMKASDQIHYVKTHEIPIDTQKAIYVVRDGRSASRSYYCYRRDFNGLTDDIKNMREVLLGFNPFGSWSNHLDTWDPLNRPGTLLLKYEDLLESPHTQIPRIAQFLGLEPRQAWTNNFDELARLEPRYFRAANANRAAEALADDDLQLFWMLHTPWMQKLGYVAADFNPQVPVMPDLFRRTLYHAVADRTGEADARRRADEVVQQLELMQARHQVLRDRLQALSRSPLMRAARALRLTAGPTGSDEL